MAYAHPSALLGFHVNMVIILAEDAAAATTEERDLISRRAVVLDRETGYSHEQETRPQTLGVAMADSPVCRRRLPSRVGSITFLRTTLPSPTTEARTSATLFSHSRNSLLATHASGQVSLETSQRYRSPSATRRSELNLPVRHIHAATVPLGGRASTRRGCTQHDRHRGGCMCCRLPGRLDRRIGDLSGQRRMLFSAAHELAHYALDSDAGNNTGMSAVSDALRLLESYSRPQLPTGLCKPTSADPLRQLGTFNPTELDVSADHLPSWTTNDSTGMPPGSWLSSSATLTHAPTPDELPAVIGMLNATVPFPGGVRAALLRLVDLLLAKARLCLVQITMLARERPFILARLGCSLGTLAFFLVVLAACRCYA